MDQYLSILVLVITAALYLYESWPLRYLMDDAYISMRYAEHWAHGQGLVFNTGEYVEGYTNFLWTALIAAGLRLGADGVMLVHYLSVLSGLFLLGACWRLAFVLAPGHRTLAALAPLLLLSSNSFADAYTSGLETTLYAALVALAVGFSLQRRLTWVWLCSSLATLTRPDGAIVAFLLFGMPALCSLQARQWGTFRRYTFWSLAYATFLLVITAIRWRYYHDLLPNTFYAKIGGIPLKVGLEYLYNNTANSLILLIPGACLYMLRAETNKSLILLTVTYFIYVIEVGGDILGHGRFLLCIEPMLLAMSIYVCAQQSKIFPRILVAGLLAAQIPWNLYALPFGNTEYQRLNTITFPASGKRAQALDHNFLGIQPLQLAQCHNIVDNHPEIHTLATIGIGLMGYCMKDVRIIDLVGLVDRTIARSDSPLSHDQTLMLYSGHQRTNATYVLGKQPDAIEIPRPGSVPLPLPCMKDLWTNETFKKNYIWDSTLNAYVKRNIQSISFNQKISQ